jgi:uncharacterized DUF497 family protein
MKITFDPVKRASTLTDRSLDFADAAEVFAGKVLNIPDERRDYGEPQGHHRRNAARANGDRGLDAARQRASRIFDEESQ